MERLRGLFGRRSGDPTSTGAQPTPFSLGICLMEGGTVSPGLSSVSGLSVLLLLPGSSVTTAHASQARGPTFSPSPCPTRFSGDIKVVCLSQMNLAWSSWGRHVAEPWINV